MKQFQPYSKTGDETHGQTNCSRSRMEQQGGSNTKKSYPLLGCDPPAENHNLKLQMTLEPFWLLNPQINPQINGENRKPIDSIWVYSSYRTYSSSCCLLYLRTKTPPKIIQDSCTSHISRFWMVYLKASSDLQEHLMYADLHGDRQEVELESKPMAL
ncbi:hypothetical protein Q8A67_024618 [Cirrhinus molitorella]|uniref:Uncharacterized protein n=1 Tax=Cirrhinus molitorella TaxID=172907 RepID=A0AA88T9L3_9TELE|nr:hypothetical protein Q8A67_024618 [Cirrhinus molitorella]